MYKYVPIIYMLMLMPMYSSGLVLGKNYEFLYVMSLILHFNTTYTENRVTSLEQLSVAEFCGE